MNDRIASLGEAERQEIEAMAATLSRYGLAITVPHMHDDDGQISPLPSGLVAYEKDLRVTFVPPEQVPTNALAMSWRFIDGELRVCANCCRV